MNDKKIISETFDLILKHFYDCLNYKILNLLNTLQSTLYYIRIAY